MSKVTAKQLLVRSVEPGRRTLSAVESREDADTWDYEDLDQGVEVPTLGSDGLLRLATALVQRGYVIGEFDLRDERFQPIDDDLESRYAEFLRARIKASTLDNGLIEQLLTSNGLVVVSVSFRIPRTGLTMTVNRDGEIRARPDDPWERFVSDIGLALGFES